ncbi:hypothetical protein TrST_g12213, partial [Triparma strigata]
MQNREAVAAELDEIKPTHVLNAAGVTGRPNVDWFGFTEEDEANFDKSWYSKTKGMVEQMLKVYEHTLVLRVRMPISDDLSPRNFITKIMK